MKIKTLTDKAKTSRKTVPALENPSLLIWEKSVLEMNAGVTESSPSGRHWGWGEKREKGKKKKEERRDPKTHQYPESKCFQSSRHRTNLPPSLPFPAALLQAPLAHTGFSWEAKPSQQWDSSWHCTCPGTLQCRMHQCSFWEVSEDHHKTVKASRPKEKWRPKNYSCPVWCLPFPTSTVQSSISLTNQAVNHSAEILQKSSVPVPKTEVTHEPGFLHAQTTEAATHSQGM